METRSRFITVSFFFFLNLQVFEHFQHKKIILKKLQPLQSFGGHLSANGSDNMCLTEELNKNIFWRKFSATKIFLVVPNYGEKIVSTRFVGNS